MQLFVGGRIFTADPEQPWADAVLVDDGVIVHVGTRHDAERFAHSSEMALDDLEVTELDGGVMTPGFVDAHAHVMMTGESLMKAQLRSATDLDEISHRLRAWSDEHPGAQRVLGIGWLFSAVPEGRPTRQMLDVVEPTRPVYLDASDLHSSWVNSAALAELGITDETPDPIGGFIVRDRDTGAATGHLLENAAVTIVWPHLAELGRVDRDQHLATAVAAYHAAGVTAAVDMAMDEDMFDAMRRAEADGTLTLRVVGHWLIHRSGDPDVELAQVAEAARLAAEAQPGDMVRIVGIKIIADGTIDGCTAALLDPYASGVNADPIWPAEALTRVVVAADAAGLQVAIHAIGDRTVREAIDALEHALAVNGQRDHRHRIEHLEYVDAADVGRLQRLGITASMQPVHVDPAQLDNWIAQIGAPRSDRGFAWREFLDAGTTLAFGTDTPTAPHLPLHNMYIAATRRSPGDPGRAAFHPEHALDLVDAIGHGTRDSAWASFEGHRIGMIKVGYRADLVTLDVDVFAGAAETLLSAQVTRTIVDGRVVHPAGRGGTAG